MECELCYKIKLVKPLLKCGEIIVRASINLVSAAILKQCCGKPNLHSCSKHRISYSTVVLDGFKVAAGFQLTWLWTSVTPPNNLFTVLSLSTSHKYICMCT